MKLRKCRMIWNWQKWNYRRLQIFCSLPLNGLYQYPKLANGYKLVKWVVIVLVFQAYKLDVHFSQQDSPQFWNQKTKHNKGQHRTLKKTPCKVNRWVGHRGPKLLVVLNSCPQGTLISLIISLRYSSGLDPLPNLIGWQVRHSSIPLGVTYTQLLTFWRSRRHVQFWWSQRFICWSIFFA